MANSVTLRAGKETLLVAVATSPFTSFLEKYFAKPQYVTVHTVNGVLNNFDKLDRGEGTIFRGSLLEWLWQARGRKVGLAA